MRLSRKEAQELMINETIYLQKKINPGDTIDCILRKVSASGMTRHISLYHNGNNITFEAACVLGENPYNEVNGSRAIKVTGCGMDMGFETVYRLGRRLFPNGFLPSEAGRTGGRNGTPVDQIDPDGGYALVQRWL